MMMEKLPIIFLTSFFSIWSLYTCYTRQKIKIGNFWKKYFGQHYEPWFSIFLQLYHTPPILLSKAWPFWRAYTLSYLHAGDNFRQSNFHYTDFSKTALKFWKIHNFEKRHLVVNFVKQNRSRIWFEVVLLFESSTLVERFNSYECFLIS